MRTRDVPAGPASARGRAPRRSVLLTTERGDSAASAELEAVCRTLPRGLPEADFVVWALSTAPQHPARPVANIVRTIEQPAWNAADGAFGTRGPRRRRPSPHDVERSFVPALRAFLEATIDPNGPGEPLAATLLDLHEHFRRWDPSRTWQSPLAWEVVRDHLLVRTADTGGEGVDPDGRDSASWSSEELPTIGEAAQGLAWLARMLAPLTIEVPKVDLVHATTSGFSAIPGVVARVERGTPLLLAEQGIAARDLYLDLQRLGAPFHLKRFAADVSGAVARTVYRVADRIAPASRHTMRWELAYGAPRTRIEVLYPGVDDERFRPMEVPRTGRPTVVQLARIEPAKDQLTLLRVADLVRREVPDVVFLQFGEVTDTEYWEEVRRTRQELGLEDAVRFVGPATDAPRAFALGDLAIVTSRSEAFPLSVLKASMCGLPVVATDVGGVRETLDGAGIVAPPEDAEALANGVSASLRISPEQRGAVRRAARDHAVARFGLQRYLDDVRAVYDRLRAPVRKKPITAEAPALGPEVVSGIPAAPEPEPAGADEVVEIPDAASGAAPNTPDPAWRRPLAPEGIEIIVPGPGDGDRIEVVEEPEEPAPREDETPRLTPSTVDNWLAAAWGHEAGGERPARATAPAAAAVGAIQAGSDRSGEEEPEALAVEEHVTAGPPPRPDRPEEQPVPAKLVPAMAGGRPRPSDLRARLADPDPNVRIETLRGLNAPTAADVVVTALSDEDVDVRREAARTLGRLNGPRAGRWLTDALSADPSAEVRGEAVAALAALLSRRPGTDP